MEISTFNYEKKPSENRRKRKDVNAKTATKTDEASASSERKNK